MIRDKNFEDFAVTKDVGHSVQSGKLILNML